MSFFDRFRRNVNTDHPLTESIESFKRKGERILTPKQVAKRSGEGIDDFAAMYVYDTANVDSSYFYNRYINKVFDNEIERLKTYRDMTETPEVSDVVEDPVNESTQEDEHGNTITLKIKNEDLAKNQNIVKNLYEEFDKLFGIEILGYFIMLIPNLSNHINGLNCHI